MALESRLERRGAARKAGVGESPDIVIVNTCTVTADADRQARQLVRRLHREHPGARILVTGCGAEVHPKDLASLPGVTDVVSIPEQSRIAERLGLTAGPSTEDTPIRHFGNRTRAFVKLQDGCNAYCNFCILPYIRGRSRSVPLGELERQVRTFAEEGYREIVLTGTHLGAWGRDLRPRQRFSDALAALVEAAGGVAIRVSSLEPTTLKPDVIELVRREPRIRPHFHIPLQSGADPVLRRMNRKYRIAHFTERVEELARTRQAVSIGTDVIVGFPGESADAFDATLKAIEQLPLTYVHQFRYSPRPGTRAAAFEDDVPAAEKKRRGHLVRVFGERKRLAFHQRFVGQIVPVLIERKRDGQGRLSGYTPHYIPVRLEGPDRLMGRDVEVRIVALEGGAVVARLV